MDWQDQAILLKHRRHGEHDAILTALTKEHGRHLGVLKGGYSSKRRATIEAGQEVKLQWHARLSEQLGRFDLEPQRNFSAAYMDDPQRLHVILSSASLLDAALPEREPHADLFLDLQELLEHLGYENWRVFYVRWEARLLSGLGYGLDLTECAVTGKKTDLKYVSPRSGRAVSEEGAGPYKERLFPLPPFLMRDDVKTDLDDIRKGMALTGHFLERHVFHSHAMPQERRRLLNIL